MRRYSRDALRPRFARNFPPPKSRGRRECRMRAAPEVSCAVYPKKGAHEHTGAAENIRHSLRNGFTAYFALSPVSPVLLPPSTPTFGTSGPHDFAVRVSAVRYRRLHVHRDPSLVGND